MATFTLSVVAPDKAVLDETVTSLIAPGTEGYFGIQAGHVPFVAALKPGLLEYMCDNQRYFVYIGGGFLEANQTRVTVLADEASTASDIDIAEAEERLEEARRALRGEGSMSSDQAVEEIERAMQRIRTAQTKRN